MPTHQHALQVMFMLADRLLDDAVYHTSHRDPGIVQWSMDHHVLRLPVYIGDPEDSDLIYQEHRRMLDEYWRFTAVCPRFQGVILGRAIGIFSVQNMTSGSGDNGAEQTPHESMAASKPQAPNRLEASATSQTNLNWSDIHKGYFGPSDCQIIYR